MLYYEGYRIELSETLNIMGVGVVMYCKKTKRLKSNFRSVILGGMLFMVTLMGFLFADSKDSGAGGAGWDNLIKTNDSNRVHNIVNQFHNTSASTLMIRNLSLDVLGEYSGYEEEISGIIEDVHMDDLLLVVSVNGNPQVVPITPQGTFKCKLTFEKGINVVAFKNDGRLLTMEHYTFISRKGKLGVFVDKATQIPSKLLEVSLDMDFANAFEADLTTLKLIAYERPLNGEYFTPNEIGTFPITQEGARYFASTNLEALGFPIEGTERRYVAELFDAKGKLQGRCLLSMPLMIQLLKKGDDTLLFYSPFIEAQYVAVSTFNGDVRNDWSLRTVKNAQLFEFPSGILSKDDSMLIFNIDSHFEHYDWIQYGVRLPQAFNDRDDTGSFEVDSFTDPNFKFPFIISGTIQKHDIDKDWIDVYINGIQQKLYLDQYGSFRSGITLKRGVNIVAVTYRNYSESKLVHYGNQQTLIIQAKPTDYLSAPIYKVPLHIPNNKILRGKTGLTLKLITSYAKSAQGPIKVETYGTYHLAEDKNGFYTTKKIDLKNLSRRNLDYCEALVYDSKGKLIIRFFVKYVRDIE